MPSLSSSLPNQDPGGALPAFAAMTRTTAPRIERREGVAGQPFSDPASEGPWLQLRGAWTAAGLAAPQVWPAMVARLRELDALDAAAQATPARWDLRQVERIDHVGAQVLWAHWGRQWPAQLQAEASQRRLLETIAHLGEAAPTPPEPGLSLVQRLVQGLGSWLLRGLAHAHGLTQLVGQLLLDVLRLLRHPRSGPWRDVSGHLYRMGAKALPITALVGFLIGVVLAYLIARQLRQFGAQAFIVNILGVSLIRELGPMLAAILMAGRSGSAITAQIGVMRVNEELDAMRVMGIAHGFRLVMPRALALALAMPLIATWTTLWSLLGGMLTADLSMQVSPAFFVRALPDAVLASNLALAVGKSVVFGLLIALIGCHYGLRIEPNTESLGAGTTASVVTSITVVILVDAVFAMVFRSVGI